jgi:hypothetical protein
MRCCGRAQEAQGYRDQRAEVAGREGDGDQDGQGGEDFVPLAERIGVPA